MKRLTVIDEIEIIMREREWLPWYVRYGPDFRDVMFCYPIERRLPPKDDGKDNQQLDRIVIDPRKQETDGCTGISSQPCN